MTPWTVDQPPPLPSLLCPWEFPGKNPGMGCHFLLQVTFPTQRSHPCSCHISCIACGFCTTEPLGKPIYRVCHVKHWAGWIASGIQIAGRNINNLRYADDTTLLAESEEKLKSLLKVKEESEKASLKPNIKKKSRSWYLVSGPINFMTNRRGKSGNSDRFSFLGL